MLIVCNLFKIHVIIVKSHYTLYFKIFSLKYKEITYSFLINWKLATGPIMTSVSVSMSVHNGP